METATRREALPMVLHLCSELRQPTCNPVDLLTPIMTSPRSKNLRLEDQPPPPSCDESMLRSSEPSRPTSGYVPATRCDCGSGPAHRINRTKILAFGGIVWGSARMLAAGTRNYCSSSAREPRWATPAPAPAARHRRRALRCRLTDDRRFSYGYYSNAPEHESGRRQVCVFNLMEIDTQPILPLKHGLEDTTTR